MLILICGIEIACQSPAMMGSDEVLQNAWYACCRCESYTFLHMSCYDTGTLLWGQTGVGIDAILVFCEEDRIGQLSDVMIQGACSYQQEFCTHLLCYGRGEVAHHDAMLVCARGFF